MATIERFKANRLAAVLVLKELAENAPTLFYSHVATSEHIRGPLRQKQEYSRKRNLALQLH